jgi:hypothetical protein
MGEITDAEIEQMRAEAEAECERCQGRENGLCDSACRYWRATATEAEIEVELRKLATWNLRTHRPWIGPRILELEAIKRGSATKEGEE